jgi:hypothetical protein
MMLPISGSDAQVHRPAEVEADHYGLHTNDATKPELRREVKRRAYHSRVYFLGRDSGGTKPAIR